MRRKIHCLNAFWAKGENTYNNQILLNMYNIWVFITSKSIIKHHPWLLPPHLHGLSIAVKKKQLLHYVQNFEFHRRCHLLVKCSNKLGGDTDDFWIEGHTDNCIMVQKISCTTYYGQMKCKPIQQSGIDFLRKQIMSKWNANQPSNQVMRGKQLKTSAKMSFLLNRYQATTEISETRTATKM